MGETINFTKKLNKIHDNICKQLPKNTTSLTELEKNLNQIFYPKKGSDEYATKRKEILESANKKLKNKISDSLKSLDVLPMQELTEEDMVKAIQAEYEAWSHKNSIQTKTLRDRRKRIQDALDKLEKNIEYSELQKKMQDYCVAVDNLLKEYTDVDTINLRAKDNLFETINNLDKAYKEISASHSLPAKTIGDILEIVLGYYSLQNIKSQTEGFIDDLTSVVTGDKKTSSKTESRTQVENLQASESTKKTIYNFGRKERQFTIEVNPSYVDNKGRSQKMDVRLYLSNSSIEDTPLRVSAKNWASLDGDFGSTSMAYAITRSYNKAFGLKSTSLIDSKSLLSQTFYGLSGKTQYNLQDIHNLVKYSIAADILMGYSQSEGYADTIIINDRSASHLYVVSIRKLMQNIYKGIEKFSVYNYKDENLQADISEILSLDKNFYQNVFETELPEEQAKRELVLRYLQNIDTSIHFSAIKNYISKKD